MIERQEVSVFPRSSVCYLMNNDGGDNENGPNCDEKGAKEMSVMMMALVRRII